MNKFLEERLISKKNTIGIEKKVFVGYRGTLKTVKGYFIEGKGADNMPFLLIKNTAKMSLQTPDH